MAHRVVLMAGPAWIDTAVLEAAADEFGCVVEAVNQPADLENYRELNVVPLAILFHREAAGAGSSWTQAIRSLKRILPGVPLIVCHGYSEPIDWSELSDAGAFHSLGLPFKMEEVRQSLGFASRTRPSSNAVATRAAL